MSKKQYSTRLPQDRAEELDQYCDETGVSKSEVLRRSIEQHLDEDDDGDRDDTRLAWYLLHVVGVSVILVNHLSLFETFPILSAVISAGIYVTLVLVTWTTQDWASL
jgi:metal-responsive CopG/Arc/MetJ family transcriptional regulator